MGYSSHGPTFRGTAAGVSYTPWGLAVVLWKVLSFCVVTCVCFVILCLCYGVGGMGYSIVLFPPSHLHHKSERYISPTLPCPFTSCLPAWCFSSQSFLELSVMWCRFMLFCRCFVAVWLLGCYYFLPVLFLLYFPRFLGLILLVIAFLLVFSLFSAASCHVLKMSSSVAAALGYLDGLCSVS